MSSNTLYAKLARIMGRIQTIPKDGTNPHFNYRYATDAAVYDTVRRLLAEESIAILANMRHVEQEHDGKTWRTRAQFEFILCDGETGQTASCMWWAEAVDSQDKGVNKCATAALKYWLLKTFVIPTGDDPDGDEPVRAGAPATGRQPRTGSKAADLGGVQSDERPGGGAPGVLVSPASRPALVERIVANVGGTPEGVRKRLQELETDGVLHAAMTDNEVMTIIANRAKKAGATAPKA